MGRFSTVQAYADNHTNVQKVSYEQATSGGNGETKKASFVQPEKVVNPYGSTAGAGSGDFHVYRHSRNRELLRQKNMDLTAAEQEADRLYQEELMRNKEWEDDRTKKRRNKRERQKNVKKRKANLMKAGIAVGGAMVDASDDQDDEDEFHYTPGKALEPLEATETAGSDTLKQGTVSESETTAPIPNDGSFLATMKLKQLQTQDA